MAESYGTTKNEYEELLNIYKEDIKYVSHVKILWAL